MAGSTRKSVFMSVVANFGSLAMSLVLLVVVARWLEPAEIGAFAVAYSAIALLEPLRLFKIIDYVIQARTMDPAAMRAVQFVGWTVSGIAFVLCIGAGLVMRESFATPEAGNLLLIMALSFPVKALAQPAMAYLQRGMRFGEVSTIRLTGTFVKAAVTIGMLLAGYRSEALAFGILAEIVCELAAIVRLPRQVALPAPSWRDARPVWNFCGKVTGAAFLSRSTVAASDLIVGSFLGLAAAGYFNRANRLVSTFRSGLERAISPVAISVFARSDRQHRAIVKPAYCNALALLTGVSWPGLLFCVLLAEPIILSAFGDRWAAIIPISQILALSGMIYAGTALTQPLLASLGAVNQLFRREVMIQIPRLVILLVAVQIDLIAVAWGLVATMLIATVVNEQIVSRELDLPLREIVANLWPSLALAVGAVVPAWAITMIPQVAARPPVVELVVALLVTAICWLLCALLFHAQLRGEILRVARRGTAMLSRRRGRQA